MQGGTIVAAFTEDQVERLTGLSKHRLRHWDRTGFFVPSLAADNRRVAFSRVYSFKDVVSLRVLSVLRLQFGVSLQHLRQVSKKLSHLDDDRWTKTTLYVLNKKVVFVDPESGTPREIVSGQYALGIALEAVISDTKRDADLLRRRPKDQVGEIVQNRLVAHNRPVIAGTRIPTAAIKRFRDAGYSVAEIIREYPDLTEKDISAALAHEEGVAA